MKMVRVGIIGAGIMGASTAFKLKECYQNLDVTIIAREFSPNTTSDGAAGFWEPFLPGDTPVDLIKRWSEQTYDYVMHQIKTNPMSSKMGLSTNHGYQLFLSENFVKPYWADIPIDYHVLTKRDLQKFPDYVKSGIGFTTVFIEARMMIPWYTTQFTKRGGKLLQKDVKSISELSEDYDIVVNCTGFGSKELINDGKLVPIRGQILKVKAPWVKEFVMFSEKDFATYILPNQRFVVLGGTKNVNSTDCTASLKDRDWIINSTKELIPSLELAEPITDWVGLRPSRNLMRVEKEDVIIKDRNGASRRVKVVHNYGHGGSGLTVHWGCACDAVSLVSEYLNDLNLKHHSKL